METNLILAVLVRWVHVLSAVTAAGGTIFLWLVLGRNGGANQVEGIASLLSAHQLRRWRMVLRSCYLLFVLSGVYNFFAISLPKVSAHDLPLYHPLFGVKVLAALGFFFLSEAITGSSEAFSGIRRKGKTSLSVAVLLAVIVLLISGVLRNL